MKKISTAEAKQIRNFAEQKLTIGLDLGDRSSWYCVLDEAWLADRGESSNRMPGARTAMMPRSCQREILIFLYFELSEEMLLSSRHGSRFNPSQRRLP